MCWSRGLAISRWRSQPDCLSVCLSVWAVRDVSTPWPTEEGVRRLLLTVAAGRLLSRGWLGGCEFSEPLRGPGSGRLRCHGDQRRRFLRAMTGSRVYRWLVATPPQ